VHISAEEGVGQEDCPGTGLPATWPGMCFSRDPHPQGGRGAGAWRWHGDPSPTALAPSPAWVAVEAGAGRSRFSLQVYRDCRAATAFCLKGGFLTPDPCLN